MPEETNSPLIRAAGGLVWRDTPEGAAILLIHRPRYNDWTLPKGKLKAGERWQDAAQREVAEETGVRAALGEFAGEVFYVHDGRPKLVLFWNMTVLDEAPFEQLPSRLSGEIDAIQWTPIERALEQLTYPTERALARQAYEYRRPQAA